MVPVIRITEETWERLKDYAIPLEDSPDSVINRVIDGLEQLGGRKVVDVSPTHKKKRRAEAINSRTKLPKTPQKDFEEPLILVLAKLGGRAPLDQIRGEIYLRVKSKLREGDYTNLLSTGEERWWNATCWARNELKEQGLISRESPRGIWELTNAGWQRASELGA